MIELSILGATLNGVLISFTFEIASVLAFLFFLLSSSSFATCGIGFMISIMEERHPEVTRRLISRITFNLSVFLFTIGLFCFMLGIATIVGDVWAYYVLIVPIVILLSVQIILRLYYMRKREV